MKKNKYSGSSFDDFLKEEGIYEEVKTLAQSEHIHGEEHGEHDSEHEGEQDREGDGEHDGEGEGEHN